VSLLGDPNCSSPANLDAGVMFRTDRDKYEAIVRRQVKESKANMPEGLDLTYEVLPPSASPVEDDSFWNDDEYTSSDGNESE
jgi:ubiquitin-conjugating enzyme E2 R